MYAHMKDRCRGSLHRPYVSGGGRGSDIEQIGNYTCILIAEVHYLTCTSHICTFSVTSALLVPLGQVLRHSEPALCLIVCVPRLAVAVTTGTVCGKQDLGTVWVGDGSAPQPVLHGGEVRGGHMRVNVVGKKDVQSQENVLSRGRWIGSWVRQNRWWMPGTPHHVHSTLTLSNTAFVVSSQRWMFISILEHWQL